MVDHPSGSSVPKHSIPQRKATRAAVFSVMPRAGRLGFGPSLPCFPPSFCAQRSSHPVIPREAKLPPRHSARSEAQSQNRAPVAFRRWLNAFPACAGPLSATAALPQCGIPPQPLRHSARSEAPTPSFCEKRSPNPVILRAAKPQPRHSERSEAPTPSFCAQRSGVAESRWHSESRQV